MKGDDVEMIKLDIQLIIVIVRFAKDKSVETFNTSKGLILECYGRNKTVWQGSVDDVGIPRIYQTAADGALRVPGKHIDCRVMAV